MLQFAVMIAAVSRTAPAVSAIAAHAAVGISCVFSKGGCGDPLGFGCSVIGGGEGEGVACVGVVCGADWAGMRMYTLISTRMSGGAPVACNHVLTSLTVIAACHVAAKEEVFDEVFEEVIEGSSRRILIVICPSCWSNLLVFVREYCSTKTRSGDITSVRATWSFMVFSWGVLRI